MNNCRKSFLYLPFLHFIRVVVCFCALVAMSGLSAQEPAALAQSLPADTELMFWDDAVTGDTYPGLIQSAEVFEPLGGIVILPDSNSGVRWLEQTHSIRRYLAKEGWTTVVVSLEPIQLNDDSEYLLQYERQIEARVAQGLSVLQQNNIDRQLLLTIGDSAFWAVNYLADPFTAGDTRLLMLDPAPAIASQWSDYLESLSQLQTTVIDLYHAAAPGRHALVPDARMRLVAAKQAGHQNYHQVRLRDEWQGWQMDMPWLNRQLRGVIRKHIIEPDMQVEPEAEIELQQRPPGRF